MSDEDGASSPDEIAVLQAYVDLINSERETIWARHNALLLANSLIVGAPAKAIPFRKKLDGQGLLFHRDELDRWVEATYESTGCAA